LCRARPASESRPYNGAAKSANSEIGPYNGTQAEAYATKSANSEVGPYNGPYNYFRG